MVLIDFSKAIDSIYHRTLRTKLKGLGASTEALNWFESYLKARLHMRFLRRFERRFLRRFLWRFQIARVN